MADKDDKQEPEFEPVGPGASLEPEDQTIRDVEGEDIRDDRGDDRNDRRAEQDSDREEDERDERAGRSEDEDGEEGPERDRIRERRRNERRHKKEQHKRDQRELNFLRSRNDALERRQSEFDARIANSEVAAIDGRISQLESDIRKADEVYSEAISKGDGQSAAEAQRIRDTLRDGVNKLQGARQQTINGTRERLNNQNRPDPAVQSRAQQWISENSSWYDHSGGNEDSLIAKAVELQLAKEKGVAAARTDAYWDEYDRRLKKRLPHLFERNDRDDDREDDQDDDRDYDESDDRDIRDHNRRTRERADERGSRERDSDRGKRRGGPRFTSGGRERPLKKNEVYVSEERRKAMEEAGVWDDPETRNRYLRQYAKFDAEAKRNRR